MAGKGSQPGERRGGRAKGTPNKATSEQRAEVAATGETPLEYMLRVVRDPSAEYPRRDHMAIAAAPYCHAKLASVEHTGKDGKDLIPELSLADTARRLAFLLTSAARSQDKP